MDRLGYRGLEMLFHRRLYRVEGRGDFHRNVSFGRIAPKVAGAGGNVFEFAEIVIDVQGLCKAAQIAVACPVVS